MYPTVKYANYYGIFAFICFTTKFQISLIKAYSNIIQIYIINYDKNNNYPKLSTKTVQESKRNFLQIFNFAQRSDLKHHAILHNYEKPFKCKQCDRCFTHKSNLTTHMLILSHFKFKNL